MRGILALLFAFTLCALDLQVDYGVEQNSRFSILSIKSRAPIPCTQSRDINDNIILIECVIDKVPKRSFAKQDLEFFEISHALKNRKFILTIRAKKKMQLFANAFDLKSNTTIPKERPSKSRAWQIIGFENEIPFLSNHKYRGLNFPINLTDYGLDSAPYIAELNIDASPLIAQEGADLATFLTLRNNFLANNYAEAIKGADIILDGYANSIFRRDALLYKIRAMDKMESENFPDDTINLAKAWIKAYGTDTNMPEVLYIVGKNYSKLRIFAEARYYYNRILDEFEGSKYAQYALVGLARNLTQNGDKRQSATLYAKAYQNAKDLDSASFVALAWAEFAILNNDTKQARNLISKVLNANPKYFLKDPKQSAEALKLWADNKLQDLSAKVGDFMLKGLENNDFKENLMPQVAQWFEDAKMPEDAYRVNSEFLSTFTESRQKDSVKKRSDNLLFAINEDDKEKQIAQFDYIIATYPNTENAKLAYAKKAQNLADLGRYAEVLELKAHLDADNENLKKSYIALIEREKSCEKIIPLWMQSRVLTKNAESTFECLFNAKAFKEARALNEQLGGGNKTKWLYNEARVHFALGDFQKSARASKDLLDLAQDLQSKINAGEILFFSQVRLDKRDEATSTFNKLLNLAPQNRALIPLQNQMLHFALNDNDTVAIEASAKALIALQNRYKSYEFSPFAELSYADALFKENKFSAVLKALENLKGANIAESQKAHYLRARAHYELGDSKNAKAEFEKCAKIKGDFSTLCDEGLNS